MSSSTRWALNELQAERSEHFQELQEDDADARQHGRLVGRYINHPVGLRSNAVYRIVARQNGKVRVRHVPGLGCASPDPGWGTETQILTERARRWVKRRERAEELFPERRRAPLRRALERDVRALEEEA